MSSQKEKYHVCLKVLELFLLAEYNELLLWNQPNSKESQTSLTVEHIVQNHLSILSLEILQWFQTASYLTVLYRIVTSVCIHQINFKWVSNRLRIEVKRLVSKQLTLYCVYRTPFEMADEQPSCNCWFSSRQSVYMASNAKRKHKSWLNIVKIKSLGRGNFLSFSNLFPGFKEHPIVFLSLNKIHATKYMQAYIQSVAFSYYFHFLLFVSQSNMKFCHKKFPLRIVSYNHWTQNRKSVSYCWNLKS